MSAQKKQRKGFTLVEVLVVLGVIAFLAALVAPKVKEKLINKTADIVNTLSALETANQQWYDDQGQYAYAPRCFQDPEWGSFEGAISGSSEKICGDKANYKGHYLSNFAVSEWINCDLDPAESASDTKGCFKRYGYLYEITTEKGKDDTYGTKGAYVVKGLTEAEALRVAGMLSGYGEHYYDGKTYSSVNIPKTESDGKSQGFWIEQDPTDSTKYILYKIF
jgi:prepilin-type N-terminal cleavage/methylation domain-containing protein